MLATLNLNRTEPFTGELGLVSLRPIDELSEQLYPMRLNHRPAMCAGGIEAVLANSEDERTHTIGRAVHRNDERRVMAVWRPVPDWHGGIIAWVRGTNSNSFTGGHLLTPDDPAKWFPGDLLLRYALSAFNWRIAFDKRRPDQRNPVLAVARHNNGFFLSGCTPNTNVQMRLRFPQGAPIFTGCETELRDGAACYRMPRAWHRECRVFIMQEDGEVFCAEQHSGEIGITRRLKLTGLKNAIVRFYPERGMREKVRMAPNAASPFVPSGPLKPQPFDNTLGHFLQMDQVNGSMLISW
ncbi:MAG: hypothetical protein NTY01_01550 [Verrucomicrobia bacterium]|nr:hypothetical protein [Verrucomicrobiota bacterium]